MALELHPDHLQTMMADAQRTYPEECCGLLLGRVTPTGRQVMEVRGMENVWDGNALDGAGSGQFLNKSRRYSIAPESMLQAMKESRSRNLEVIGVYHSHPDNPAVPSECDRQFAWSHYSYLIVSVRSGQATDYTSWVLDDHDRFQPEPIQLRVTNLINPET